MMFYICCEILNISVMEAHCTNKDLIDITGEEWRDVIGYDGFYQISNKGRLKSLPRTFFTAKGVECISKEKIKSLRLPTDKGNGRTNTICEYSLEGVNKRYNFSKQIALHFLKGYNNETLYFVDGNRANCSIENLIVVNEHNVFELYDNNTIIPPNEVSELLHKIGYKKCSVCKKIKRISNFSKCNRNRNVNNNCQSCVNKLVYKWRNDL